MSPNPAWLDHLLETPGVTDVCLNGTSEMFVDRGAGLEPWSNHSPRWTEESFKSWVLALISSAGKTWDARSPFVDASLPGGHRLHVVFPPIARNGILVSLRRLPRPASQTVQEGPAILKRWLQGGPAEREPLLLLQAAVRRGESMLISGATGGGKTTLANDLLHSVPHSERIIALEDTPELAPCHPHFLTLVSRPPSPDGFGEVTLRSLLRQALRMRPDRIILGECRGGEVLDLLQVLNTGHQGAIATLHANSPRDALRRIELLCQLHSQGAVPSSSLREMLAHGIQWIVQVGRTAERRAIREVWRVEGREGDTILMRPMVQQDK